MAYADFSRFVVTAANEPSARSPRIRCTPFPSIHLLHLLGSYKWQLYGFVLYGRLTKQSPALYAVSVRQARGLLTASFRFFLAEDTLAVQLYASSLPRRIRDFHPLGRAHGAHTTKKAPDNICQELHRWASRIRTYEMTESESVALPLGYSPIVRDGFLSVTNCYYTDGICGLQALFYSQSNGPTG